MSRSSAGDSYGRPRDERPYFTAYLAAAAGLLGVILEVVAYLPFLRRDGPWPEEVVDPGVLGSQLGFAFVALAAYFGWNLGRWIRQAEGDGAPWFWSLEWTVAAWVIPVLNFVAPFFVLREVWVHLVGSDRAARTPSTLVFGFLAWATGNVLLLAAWIATEFMSGVDDVVLGALRLGSLGSRLLAAVLLALFLHALAAAPATGPSDAGERRRDER